MVFSKLLIKTINSTFAKPITDEGGVIQFTIPPGADEMEILNFENKWIIIEEEHFTETDYSFQIKPIVSTLGSIIKISSQGPLINVLPIDGIRDLLEFNANTIYEEYNSSPKHVDILSFHNVFIETDIAKGLIYKCKKAGILHNWSMKVNPGCKFVERFSGGITWYMMESKDVISSFNFELKNEKTELVSFNGQSTTFHLSTKKI